MSRIISPSNAIREVDPMSLPFRRVDTERGGRAARAITSAVVFQTFVLSPLKKPFSP